jgi:hypothetical protein
MTITSSCFTKVFSRQTQAVVKAVLDLSMRFNSPPERAWKIESQTQA